MIDPLVAALKLVNLSLNFKKISKRKKNNKIQKIFDSKKS